MLYRPLETAFELPRKDDMSCLAGRHLGDLVGQKKLTLDAGLMVVAMCDDRSIGNLRPEARHPRDGFKNANWLCRV